MKKLIRTNEEWKAFLTQDQFHILREHGTEPAFAKNNWYYNKEDGDYCCVACDNLLFSSKNKYESGTGWPSFTQPADKNSVELGQGSYEEGKEVHCKRCEGHLGHVFDDGPSDKGCLRFCIDGRTLDFIPKNSETAYFAAGCFWHVQYVFDKLSIIKSYAGYMGGNEEKYPAPYFMLLHEENTGYAETVKIIFNPKKISYKELLKAFWDEHSPISKNRQGGDVGSQYRTAIFYTNKSQRKEAEESLKEIKKKYKNKEIFTTIEPAGTFFKAEIYHQKYLEKNE